LLACRDKDLEMLFSRFGKVTDCSIMWDKTSGDSLGYAFIGFESRDACEMAYFKMNNVLVDDRRIRVDFSQSVAKLWAQSRRGGAMPHMAGDGGRGRAGGFRGGNVGLTQQGRIGGQLIDIRLKSSALGSATEAAAVSRTMQRHLRAGEDRREAAAAAGGSSRHEGSSHMPEARRDRPDPQVSGAGLAAAMLRAKAIAASFGEAPPDAGSSAGLGGGRRTGRRDEDRD
jgi:peptidyl-prolyl cis-trans isomerase-like 4